MNRYCTYLVLVLNISAFLPHLLIASGQDTIPPVFTTLPNDVSISCMDEVTDPFTDWFTTMAGAEADNGEANIFTTIPLNAALDSLASIQDEGCSGPMQLTLAFFAIDSCGNRTVENESANFILTDNIPPTIISEVQNLTVSCDSSTIQNLQAWLDQRGAAIIEDNCSDSISLINYTWEDSAGNQGIGNDSLLTNIMVSRSECAWSVTVNFVIEDGCGNINSTEGVFAITDDIVPPIVSFFPPDTTILCNQIIPDTIPTFLDECDGIIASVVQIDSTNRSTDTLTCEYYNYEIYRKFSASDRCGNTLDTTQVIAIRDTLAPIIQGSPTIAVDCDDNLNNIDLFISPSDNCAVVSTSARDSIIFNSSCQNQIQRQWIAEDVCGNIDSFLQIIQIQDFTGPDFIVFPRDTILTCENSNISDLFDNWVSNFGGAVVEDNCSEFQIKGLPPSAYRDTSEILNVPVPVLDMIDCSNMIGAIFTQQVSFVAFDRCNNITQREALFSITDPSPPIITDCPTNVEINLDNDQCLTSFSVVLPQFSDNCLSESDARWRLTVNNNLVTNVAQEGLPLLLDVGTNRLEFTISDCGANSATCAYDVSVQDSSPPSFDCPEDQIFYVAENECDLEFSPASVANFSDNCPIPSTFQQTRPNGLGLLNFTFNSVEEIYQASDFIINFENIFLPNNAANIELFIEYFLELDVGSEIFIRDEQGNIIETLTQGNCTVRNSTLNIAAEDLQNWAQDGTISFIIINRSNNGTGTQPCEPSNLMSTQGTDGTSFLRLSLSYSDITPEIVLTDEQLDSSFNIAGTTVLEPGDYTLHYTLTDDSSNEGTCIQNISIQDTLLPSLICQDITINARIDNHENISVSESMLGFQTNDNCEVDSIDFSPSEISCSETGNTVIYQVSVSDVHGNNTSCQQNIFIEQETLSPTFQSGLCFADTLKLFSNLDSNLGLLVEWQGPNGFSSNQLDPIIPNINANFSGDYILTARTQRGCEFVGAINIDVSEFDSPDIFTTTPSTCLGTEILLNTNSFTEIVEYFWFEGISPNGTLIGQTAGPSFALTPIAGNHFYYVEVSGNDCNSNPSNTLEIFVADPPVAAFENPFITLCEGDDLELNAINSNPNLSYEWIGPDNYFSTEANPPIIESITRDNQGTYSLSVADGECISNTATAEVIIISKPERPFISGEAVFCEGQSAVLTVPNITNGNRYLWFNNGEFFSSVGTNTLLIPSINVNQSGNWTVVTEVGICTSDTSDVFVVNVDANLNIGATNDGPHCEGDSVLLTASFIPDATYRWEDPNGELIEGRIITTLAIEGTYSVTVTTLSTCQAITNTNVSVGQRPTITAVSNTSLPCMNGQMPVTLVPTVFPPGNYTYAWTGPNNYNSAIEMPVINNVNESDNGIYTLTVSLGNCESEPLSTTINITDIPDQPIIDSDTDFCTNDEVILVITNPQTGTNVTWQWSTPQGIITTSEPQFVIPSFNSDNTGDYAVIQSRNECNSQQSETVTIEIRTEQIVPIIQSIEDICEGEDLIINSVNTDGEQFIWFTPRGTRITDLPELEILEASQLDAGSYSLSIIEGNCVSDTSETVSLNIIATPNPISLQTEDMLICADERSDLIVCISESNPNADLIQLIDVNTGTIIQESNDTCFDISFLLDAGNRNFQLSPIIEIDGCPSQISDTLSIEIFDIPDSPAEVFDDQIFVCNSDFISITADIIPPDVMIEWRTADPDINIFGSTSAEVSLSNLNIGSNLVFLSSSNGQCANFATDTIEVIMLTEIEANDDIFNVDFGTSITVDILENDLFSEGIIISLISSPEIGVVEVVSKQLIFSPPTNFIGEIQLDYEICYTECEQICSRATLFLDIGQNAECFVGNVFTPNGDGYNDILTVPCLESNNFPQNSLTIFNQWGDELFSAAPYNNNWEGTHNGDQLPASTYYYILDLGDGSRPIQGFIVLEL